MLASLAVACQSTPEAAPAAEQRASGVGLVVGLPGTGEASEAVLDWLRNLLHGAHGIALRLEDLVPRSAARVHVRCLVPADARAGDRVDVRVEAFDASVSLCGGVLLQALLLDRDGQVQVVASGSVARTCAADATRATPVPAGFVSDGAVSDGVVSDGIVVR